jgi:hypothetical protein
MSQWSPEAMKKMRERKQEKKELRRLAGQVKRAKPKTEPSSDGPRKVLRWSKRRLISLLDGVTKGKGLDELCNQWHCDKEILRRGLICLKNDFDSQFMTVDQIGVFHKITWLLDIIA